MKYYVITGTKDWADEFDVHFFEILNEDDKRIYETAQYILKSLTLDYSFGTNEEFEEFDYLDWDLQEITSEERDFLNRIGVTGCTVYDGFLDIVSDIIYHHKLANFDDFDYQELMYNLTDEELEDLFKSIKLIIENEK